MIHGGFGSKRDDVDADTEIFLRAVDRLVDDRDALDAAEAFAKSKG